MSSGCPYANIFGKPGEGPHAWRFLGVAVIDVFFTALFAVLVAKIWKISFWRTFLALILIGEVAHWYFGVPTAVLVWLGVARRCH